MRKLIASYINKRRDQRIIMLEAELAEVIDNHVTLWQDWQNTLDVCCALRTRLAKRDRLRIEAQRRAAVLKGELALALENDAMSRHLLDSALQELAELQDTTQ